MLNIQWLCDKHHHCGGSGNRTLLRCLPRDPAITESLFWGTTSNTTFFWRYLIISVAEAWSGTGSRWRQVRVPCRVLRWTQKCRRVERCGFSCQYSPLGDPHCQDGKGHSELNCFKWRLFSYLNHILWGTENLPGEVFSETTLVLVANFHDFQVPLCFVILPYVPLG